LTGTDQTELAPEDVFVIETPGGGGYGYPADEASTSSASNITEGRFQ
jgi:N-methylhydantoinase B/oxoprolinase/acetone carboxylase alpha subunit